MQERIHSLVDDGIKKYDLDAHGWVSLSTPLSFEKYDSWIAKGLHADMHYLERHREQKAEPTRWMPTAKTALVVTKSYLQIDDKPISFGTDLIVARYAQGADYHDWLSGKLGAMGNELQTQIEGFEFRVFTDSSPVLERDLAARAGLGWIGKNGCVIDRKLGSFFFIGGLYTNLDIRIEPKPINDFCGNCDRCIQSCPTEAILPDRTLDAKRCISYHTIENKKSIPLEIQKHMGSLFFGCDICQEVCPWNKKPLSAFANRSPEKKLDLEFFLLAADSEVKEAIAGTPLARAKPHGLRRNAVVIARNKNEELWNARIEKAFSKFPYLKELFENQPKKGLSLQASQEGSSYDLPC